jgi:hypothetical protein
VACLSGLFFLAPSNPTPSCPVTGNAFGIIIFPIAETSYRQHQARGIRSHPKCRHRPAPVPPADLASRRIPLGSSAVLTRLCRPRTALRNQRFRRHGPQALMRLRGRIRDWPPCSRRRVRAIQTIQRPPKRPHHAASRTGGLSWRRRLFPRDYGPPIFAGGSVYCWH